ncbi:hypothetical protein [Dactylosporangium sp. NPDC048998]|uniref:hypothetical protein n=1 Tax=Dactylosporangium sp. NPDC048998 TaxID=3363976 RepID=UPI0037164F26
MDVVAQWVRTSWTVRSRGAPGAAARNAVAVGFPLPFVACPAVHEVVVDESRDFVPEGRFRVAEPDRKDVLLQEAGGRLRVALVADTWGMPRRRRRPPAVWLACGEWVRWQINYRFSWPAARGGAWRYRLDTLNLGYGTVAADAFTGVPTRYVDERAHLR